MRVSKERLSVIGRLIGIYREERRDNTQNEYTQKRFCDGICSPNTLKSIEAGGLSRSEDIYIELLDKLGLKYGEFPAIDEAIDELMVKLYEAIEYYDEDKILEITNKGIRLLKSVNNYVVYSETYSIFHSVYSYYFKDSLINDRDLIHYNFILYAIPNQFQSVLKILIFSKLKLESMNDKCNYKKLVERLNIENDEFICLKINLLHFYFIMGNYLTMIELIIQLENYFIKTNNNVRLLDTYNYAVVLLSYIDDQKKITFIEKAKRLLHKHEFTDLKKCEAYSNIASAFYKSGDYENALKYYQQAILYHSYEVLTKLILIADCQRRLGLPINIKQVEESEIINYSMNIRMMYKYFTLDKLDVPDFVKQNYIMKKILPDLNDEIFISIFRNELSTLVERTNHYKDVHIYEKRVRENTLG